MFRHDLGLDQPVWKQFADYVWQLLHGDFGTSLATNQKVLTEFAALFPATLELAAAGMLFAVLLGLPAGTIAAAKRGTVFDQTLMGLSVTGYSIMGLIDAPGRIAGGSVRDAVCTAVGPRMVGTSAITAMLTARPPLPWRGAS